MHWWAGRGHLDATVAAKKKVLQELRGALVETKVQRQRLELEVVRVETMVACMGDAGGPGLDGATAERVRTILSDIETQVRVLGRVSENRARFMPEASGKDVAGKVSTKNVIEQVDSYFAAGPSK